jgi:hypothetical protein
MLLLTAIIVYILSLVIALVLVVVSKRINPGWFRMVVGIHIVLGVFFLFTLSVFKEEVNLAFLFFFCSGIVTSGIAFGLKVAIPLRIYFGLYSASIFLFIISPSTLLNFLIHPAFSTDKEKTIQVRGNYFLEAQNAMSADNAVQYKLIHKTGMFHRTIMRNINFNGRIDSIKVLSFEDGIAAEVRGYSNRKTFVTDEVDSADVNINLNPANKDVIERRL